jgi:hypothetical protein
MIRVRIIRVSSDVHDRFHPRSVSNNVITQHHLQRCVRRSQRDRVTVVRRADRDGVGLEIIRLCDDDVTIAYDEFRMEAQLGVCAWWSWGGGGEGPPPPRAARTNTVTSESKLTPSSSSANKEEEEGGGGHAPSDLGLQCHPTGGRRHSHL